MAMVGHEGRGGVSAVRQTARNKKIKTTERGDAAFLGPSHIPRATAIRQSTKSSVNGASNTGTVLHNNKKVHVNYFNLEQVKLSWERSCQVAEAGFEELKFPRADAILNLEAAMCL